MGKTQQLGTLVNGLTVDANGNVGIATTPTTDRLTISGNTTVLGSVNVSSYQYFTSIYGGYIFGYTGTTYTPMTYSASYHSFSTSGTEKLRITNSGNVGIGTSSPSSILHLNGTDATLTLQGTRGTGGTHTIGASGANNTNLSIVASSGMYLTTNGVDRLVIASDGEFLFKGGTNSIITQNMDKTGWSLYRAYANSNAVEFQIRTGVDGAGNYVRLGNYTSNDLLLMTGATERMRITSSGNVGIGTSSPNYKLDILGNTSSSGDVTMIRLNNNNGENCGNIDFDNVFGNLARITGTKMAGGSLADDGMLVFSTAVNSALSERMRIRNNGSIMLNGNDFGSVYNFSFKGVTGLDCFAALSVRNNGDNIINFFNQASGYVASISVAASSVTYGTGSDYRLKEDLKDFDGLAKISAIKVYDFKFKQAGDRMEGVLAHELKEIIPYAVNGEKDEVDENGLPKIQNVDYSKIVPVLIKSVQQLKAEIEILKNK